MTTGQGRTDQEDERLRRATREWLDAAAAVDAVLDNGEPLDVLELAEQATLARLRFEQTLVELGWTRPGRT